MIEHVHRRAMESGAIEVVVATDDERIADVVRGFGGAVCMTDPAHRSGTDRLAEVATRLSWPDNSIVVNLQGDEPLMPAGLIRQVADNLAARPSADMATLATPIAHREEVFNTHAVKVVRDKFGNAIYFSRAPIPYARDSFSDDSDQIPAGAHWLRHIGLYAYHAAALRAYPALPDCDIEHLEALEQLRGLYNGLTIHVDIAMEAPPPGVDTQVDLDRAEAALIRFTTR